MKTVGGKSSFTTTTRHALRRPKTKEKIEWKTNQNFPDFTQLKLFQNAFAKREVTRSLAHI